MDTWETYAMRLGDLGGTARNISLIQEQNMLTHMIKDSLSYHHVMIDDVPRNVAIINSDNLNEKMIYSLPGEELVCGNLVYWMNNYWLLTELDANTEVYTRGKLLECNHLLKWVSTDGVIHQQWSVVEDGTKLRKIVSAQRNLRVKRPIELLESPKAETSGNANAAKAERNGRMAHGQILNAE